MAIREYSPEGPLRQTIGFVGVMPEERDLQRFRERRFLCESIGVRDLEQSDKVAQLDAVICSQDARKPNALPRVLATFVPRLLDFDVRVYLRAATDEQLADMPRALLVNALLENGSPVANLRPEE